MVTKLRDFCSLMCYEMLKSVVEGFKILDISPFNRVLDLLYSQAKLYTNSLFSCIE